jgi:hypothetical protein
LTLLHYQLLKLRLLSAAPDMPSVSHAVVLLAGHAYGFSSVPVIMPAPIAAPATSSAAAGGHGVNGLGGTGQQLLAAQQRACFAHHQQQVLPPVPVNAAPDAGPGSSLSTAASRMGAGLGQGRMWSPFAAVSDLPEELHESAGGPELGKPRDATVAQHLGMYLHLHPMVLLP